MSTARCRVAVALLTVAGYAGISPVLAQPVVDLSEELDFNRTEAWGYKYFTSVTLMSSFGAPKALDSGSLALGFEIGQVPSLTEDQRRIGFNGTKVEDLNRLADHLAHPGYVMVIIESQDSAFVRTKSDIYPDLGATLVTESMVARTAEDLGWPSPERLELPQRFSVDRSTFASAEIKDSAFPWFIFESYTSHCGDVPTDLLRRAARHLLSQLQVTT